MSAPLITILYTASVAQSLAFYRQLLGREPVEASDNFVMFAINEQAMLGIWKADKVQPALEDHPEPSMPAAAGGELCFPVADSLSLHRLYDQCVSRGETVLLPPTTAEFGLTFTLADPDGHRIRYLVAN